MADTGQGGHDPLDIAQEFLPLLEKEAKERQKEGSKVGKSGATLPVAGKVSESAAKLTGANPRYIEMVKASWWTAFVRVPEAKKVAALHVQDRKKVPAMRNGQVPILISRIPAWAMSPDPRGGRHRTSRVKSYLGRGRMALSESSGFRNSFVCNARNRRIILLWRGPEPFQAQK